MNYIVLDMEWNQPFTKKKKQAGGTFLKGEIIQMGAVKLDSDFNIVGSFNESVCPIYYKTLNRHVKKITGLVAADLKKCDKFTQVYGRFAEFCGDEYCFITWGCDDLPMLRDNMEAYEIDTAALPRCYNLQSIFNSQISHEARQWSLAAAMEKLEIEQTLQPHDALSDAINTVYIAQKLDLKNGLEQYGKTDCSGISCNTLISVKLGGFATMGEAVRRAQAIKTECPFCKNILETKGWIGKRNKKVALGSCNEHGTFKFQSVIYKQEDKFFIKNKVSYASEEMKQSYAEKTAMKV